MIDNRSMSDPCPPDHPPSRPSTAVEPGATVFRPEHAWTANGWLHRPALGVGPDGLWRAPTPLPGAATARAVGSVAELQLPGWTLPGLCNGHSHAFQRAMAGLAERRGSRTDSFWTWRETMYRIAARFDPDLLHAVAAWLYAEMLEAGYTRVCEFHYLHHGADGRPYADSAAMSLALIEAARETGIGLTLLPVLYQRGGFDDRPLSERQRRFGHDLDGYLGLLDSLSGSVSESATHAPGLRLGVAFHSLRAVPESAIEAVLSACAERDWPIHIHIAEQPAEVAECLASTGARPIQRLHDRFALDGRWTLVHATHCDASERNALAATGVTVALCPTTEANLGDGLFPLPEFTAASGRWCIGSDSHVSVSPVEELRWLEYGQRLRTGQRNLVTGPHSDSVGESLLAAALTGGAAAAGIAVSGLRPGDRADFVVLDPDSPGLIAASPEDLIDRWLFSGNRPAVRETWVAARRRVAEGRHVERDRLFAAFRRAMRCLLSTG